MNLFARQFTGLVLIILAAAVVPSGCPAQSPQQTIDVVKQEKFVEELVAGMTTAEKLGQLNQYRWNWSPSGKTEREKHRMGVKDGRIGSFLGVQGADLTRDLQRIAIEESRLGIPLLFAQDVIHGWRTVTPVPLAETCSWDPGLVRESARMAATEATAQGIHWTFAPMVDIARDPRWGRIVEGAGEDPYLGAAMAGARVQGFQGADLAAENTMLACAKHFCAYGAAEGGRDYNTVEISEATLQEIYLPPFRAAVDAGVRTFMGAFNEIGGIPMHANTGLIRDLLRGQWGFDGIVISDYTAIMELLRHGVAADSTAAGLLALTAGVDIDMVSGIYLNLPPSVIPENLLDEAVKRVLRAKYQLGLFSDPYRYSNEQRESDDILTTDNRSLARKIARESVVLLKNEGNLLPLSKDPGKLCVIGSLANDPNAPLGSWSGAGQPGDVITVLDGIKQAVSRNTTIAYYPGYDPADFTKADDFDKVLREASGSDMIILVLGEGPHMSGEASSRSSIGLPGDQTELAKKVHTLGKPTVLILMNGRPLAIPWLAENIPAILETWFLGVEMGSAVADILFGDCNPAGKLPVTFPRATGQIPLYYNHKNTGRPPDPEDHFTSKYLDIDWTPQFPFGYGLSYTHFIYGMPSLSREIITAGDELTISVEVKNTGTYAGQEVIQLYLHDEVATVTPAVIKLCRFQKVALDPGESRQITFTIGTADLQFYKPDAGWVTEPGFFSIHIGGNSVDTQTARFEMVSSN